MMLPTFYREFGLNCSLNHLNPFPSGLDIMSVLDSGLSVLVFHSDCVPTSSFVLDFMGIFGKKLGETTLVPAVLMSQKIAP